MNSQSLLALTNPAVPGAAAISLTNALLVLTFAGVLLAAYLLNRVSQRLAAIERQLQPGRGPVAPAVTEPVKRADVGDLPPELLAAIVAACHVQVGGQIRIVSIADPADQKQVWSLEGRRQIFASHRPR